MKKSIKFFKSDGKDPSKVYYALFLVLFLTSSMFLSGVAQSQAFFSIGEFRIPVSAFTGVISSMANMCLIFMVVFFHKLGFVTALILLVVQFPILLRNMFVLHNTASIPGIFTTILTILAIILIYRRNIQIDKYQSSEIEHLRETQKLSMRLFEQTATALVNAIDAKDVYSHGHSLRVAEYSEKIARYCGMNDEECYRIYYTALLHDVGKIGISDSIINKNGRLTPEEYDIIKQHPVMGNQILTSISEYPYLSIGAHYHHERYDGKGYPDGLKGEDIPEIARIISVADAYDAMTSNRSYRDAIPQQIVREEIVKGAGTQFDPKFAMIMQHLIDLDGEYKMKERIAINELAGKDGIVCEECRSEISEGINITAAITRIHLKFTPDLKASGSRQAPALIVFDSLDGRVHGDERMIRDLNYYEYCEIWLDGTYTDTGVRKVQSVVKQSGASAPAGDVAVSAGSGSGSPDDRTKALKETVYDIEAVKFKDHVLIRVNDGSKINEITIALPDSTRYVYISLTGEHCMISDVRIDKDDKEIGAGYITRIAEEISFIDRPSGDMPNVQIDGNRTDISRGVPVVDGMKISFHTMSLPTARLIWHCPFISLYSSDDGRFDGPNFREYALIRLDGEKMETGEVADNKLIVNKTEAFEGWDIWKQANKVGFECVISFRRKANTVIITTENLGIGIRNITTINDGTHNVYAAITGDQVAITDIRVFGCIQL